VLRGFEVPAQCRGNGAGDDRGQRCVVEFAFGVAARLRQLGANAPPQLSLDRRCCARRGTIRPGCF
jgi:hypothetical protein